METFWWGEEYISLGIPRVWFSVGLHCLRGAFMAIVHLVFSPCLSWRGLGVPLFALPCLALRVLTLPLPVFLSCYPFRPGDLAHFYPPFGLFVLSSALVVIYRRREETLFCRSLSAGRP